MQQREGRKHDHKVHAVKQDTERVDRLVLKMEQELNALKEKERVVLRDAAAMRKRHRDKAKQRSAVEAAQRERGRVEL